MGSLDSVPDLRDGFELLTALTLSEVRSRFASSTGLRLTAVRRTAVSCGEQAGEEGALECYHAFLAAYREASARRQAGDLTAVFPGGSFPLAPRSAFETERRPKLKSFRPVPPTFRSWLETAEVCLRSEKRGRGGRLGQQRIGVSRPENPTLDEERARSGPDKPCRPSLLCAFSIVCVAPSWGTDRSKAEVGIRLQAPG